MTEAIIVAILGAMFNTGVMWGTLKALIWRIENAEKVAHAAHNRIDNLRDAA